MGHRISRIYTRTGDAGQTGLGNGQRVAKNSPRIHAIGEIDEANATLGLLLTEDLPDDVREVLLSIQHEMFDLGAEMCMPPASIISSRQVKRLEKVIDRYNGELAPLRDFILPGGSRAGAQAHFARTVCRRAERAVVALAQVEPVNDAPRQYLNRLSDLLFVLARVLNRAGGHGDVLWQKSSM